MGRRKKKKKRSSVHQQNTAAPSAVAESSAPKAAKQGPDSGKRDSEHPQSDLSADSKAAKSGEKSPREIPESERLEAALRERSPFTGKFEPYDVEAHGLEWEEMPLSEELSDIVRRVSAGKRSDEERNQPKVQVDPELARESGFAQERKTDKDEPQPQPRSRAGLYAVGAVALAAVVVGVFLWPGLRTRGVGAAVGANEDAQTETLPSSVRVLTDSDEEGVDEDARQGTSVASVASVGDDDPQAEPKDGGNLPEAEAQLKDTAFSGESGAVEKEEATAAADAEAEKDAKDEQKASIEQREAPAEVSTSGESPVHAAKVEKAETKRERPVKKENPKQADKKERAAAHQGGSTETQDSPDVANLTHWKTQLKRTTGWKNKVEFLRKYVNTHPRDDAAMARLATMLMEMRFARKEANSLARKAAKINPDNAAAWLVIGYVHQLSGDKKAAGEAYRKCSQCSGPPYYVTECRRLL